MNKNLSEAITINDKWQGNGHNNHKNRTEWSDKEHSKETTTSTHSLGLLCLVEQSKPQLQSTTFTPLNFFISTLNKQNFSMALQK